LVSVVALPAQVLAVPPMAAGLGFTVATTLRLQPLGVVYDTMVVPAVIPVIAPLVAFAVAILLLSLLQVPPVIASVRVTVVPGQTFAVPVMVAGRAFTVTAVTLRHMPPTV
jgi:hypothetical protein